MQPCSSRSWSFAGAARWPLCRHSALAAKDQPRAVSSGSGFPRQPAAKSWFANRPHPFQPLQARQRVGSAGDSCGSCFGRGRVSREVVPVPVHGVTFKQATPVCSYECIHQLHLMHPLLFPVPNLWHFSRKGSGVFWEGEQLHSLQRYSWAEMHRAGRGVLRNNLPPASTFRFCCGRWQSCVISEDISDPVFSVFTAHLVEQLQLFLAAALCPAAQHMPSSFPTSLNFS